MAVEKVSDLKPVYLIFSSEEMLLERATRRLKDRLAKSADLDFNFDSFEGESTAADVVIAAANTLPFMSDRRLIVLNGVDKMPTAEQALLAVYAADPAAHTCLVMTAVKVVKSSRLYKAVDALGGVAEYAAPKKSEYPAWVTGLFRDRGKTIGVDAAEVLVRAVGRDLRRLDIEADKVCAFVGDVATVERDDVEAVMSTTAPTSVFDFLDAVGARECRTALRLLAELVGEGESVLAVHAMSLRHVRNLLSAKSLLDRGQSIGDVAETLGLQGWQARNVGRQASRFEAEDLIGAIRAAAEAEAKMKTSQDPRLVFERWLIALCGEAPGS